MCEQFTMSSFVRSLINIIVTIAVAYATYKATKRYAAGRAQIVEKALNQERLDISAEIINQASKLSDAAEVTLLSAFVQGDSDKFSLLLDTFYDLELVCSLIQDNALPPKVKESALNRILNYLSTGNVLCFVEANKLTFPKLRAIAISGR